MTTKQELEKALEDLIQAEVNAESMKDYKATITIKFKTLCALRHVLTQALREDVVTLPREPTNEMIMAAMSGTAHGPLPVYQRMVAAFEKDGGR